MLFRLIREGEKTKFQTFVKRSASELHLAEKDLENWMSSNPALLFGNEEEVLVIAQSVSGLSMADILALDAEGNLVIIEIKRDWSDRSTVGQLLEYAADKAASNYEDLEELHRDYWERNSSEPYICLLDRFRELAGDRTAEKKDIPKRPGGHRLCIVAPDSDEGLRRIIKWLKGYGVPISFIPFALYADADNDTGEVLLEIEQLPRVQAAEESVVGEWQGDWFFNTNETYAPGAYLKMFDQGVIAIFGYSNGPGNLEGSAAGQRVFAYVNRKGILACGRIVDGKVFPGQTVFEGDREFHVKVQWETIVADDKGVKNEEIRQRFNCSLPVRKVFCGMYRHQITAWIADELQRRKQ